LAKLTYQNRMQRIFSVALFLFFFSSIAQAQAPLKPTTGELYESIQKLNFLGTVLYVAAHPDDENTRLISYFANNYKARTGYLSLTRGDGGQNLIGPEMRELLGMIRTQELLAARRIDGGQQFFTRANDFGYSKHPDETLQIWDKEEVMQDVVAVIRRFKPDIIVNRFNHRTPGSTHGHHTTSAILSTAAFDLAADKNYKTHLAKDETWQAKRLFFNTSWWFYGSAENFKKADKTNLLAIDIGTYYRHKGLSNSEIASLSRSKHRSQGFGSTGTRGSTEEYLEFLKGEFPKNKEVFEGIDTTWGRVPGGDKVGVILERVEQEFDFKNPAGSIPGLVEAYKILLTLDEGHWRTIKLKEIKECIAACAGMYLEAVANRATTTIGAQNTFRIEAINRSEYDMKLESVKLEPIGVSQTTDSILIHNQDQLYTLEGKIPDTAAMTYPYWLHNTGTLGMYEVENPSLITTPETPRSVYAIFNVIIGSIRIPFKRPVVYKFNDPVKGEVYRPFEILPEVFADFDEKVYLFSSTETQSINLRLRAVSTGLKGAVRLQLPEDWSVSPEQIDLTFTDAGEEQLITFQITPPEGQSEGYITPQIQIGDKTYSYALNEISYDHIPHQSVVMPAKAKIVRLNLQKKGQVIGYIQGAGDEVPTSLRQIGYTVVELSNGDINAQRLANFDAVILGIRLYNTNERTKFFQKDLFEYVKNGGTLITQYNTSRGLKVQDVGPYPLKLSRDRVTEENAAVKLVNPEHELLNYPNKIVSEDFEGWVQERGLYFPGEWDERYEAVISMNDQNESPKTGSLLVAKYGEGNFIYTGLSFFRELPAGVPGAYKLFTNMLSIGKNKPVATLKN
jgi:LmbE family N-acetylglucosaminyl deacetylase